MAEAGSFADRVKQQADIVRVVGEYVRLKKTGKDFSGLCPFHQEKTPSFTVSPIKQIFYCFGCGKGGDVFNFVREMEKCDFPEALKIVAEKCGIALPAARERSPEERRETHHRTLILEMHRAAQTFYTKQLEGTPEGRVAQAYLEDRGLNKAAIEQFGIGYAPSGGDVLLRFLRPKCKDEKLLAESGLISRDQSGRLFDRFRRRITFPIANEGGKIVAFGCRALGDDTPKYLNSPETPIYSKSNVLYHLDRAKEALRRQDFAVLVEGYMDAIAVARAGISNVVASCGTSLAEPQIKLLARFTKRVIVNYDPDSAGQAATERSVALLLEQDFEVKVLALPSIGDRKADPDLFIREKGAEEYLKLLKAAPPYVDYLIARARRMDMSTGEGKLRAVNFLLPYVQKIPNRLLRSEWATRIAAHLRIDEPVLRAQFSKAATERRSELKAQPETLNQLANSFERMLIWMLCDAVEFKAELARRLQQENLHEGMESERTITALIAATLAPVPIAMNEVAETLNARDRGLLYSVLFTEFGKPTWAQAESCISKLRIHRLTRQLEDLKRELTKRSDEGKEDVSGESRKIQAEIDDLRAQILAEEPISKPQVNTENVREVDPEIQQMIDESNRRFR